MPLITVAACWNHRAALFHTLASLALAIDTKAVLGVGMPLIRRTPQQADHLVHLTLQCFF